MKCENCGKNEANFVYRSSINGRTEEYHLCQACAEKLGYTQRFFEQRPSIMDSFFGNNGFFGSMPSLMGRIPLIFCFAFYLSRGLLITSVLPVLWQRLHSLNSLFPQFKLF